jgi:hypothetical protein
MNAEARRSVTAQTGVKEENLLKRGRKTDSEIPQTVLKGGKNHPGVFRLKKFSMENIQKYMLKDSLTD